MDGSADDDPFSWDVATVVKVLTAPNCHWATDRPALAERIREQEIDGKTLLTYEQVCSRQELMEYLGIRLARHKVAIGELILTLRSKSWAYQHWRQDFNRKQAGIYFDPDGYRTPLTSNVGVNRHVLPLSQPIDREAETSRQPQSPIQQVLLSSNPVTPAPAPHENSELSPLQAGTLENDHPTSPGLPSPPQASEAPIRDSEETIQATLPELANPPKPRRIAPVTMISRPLNISNAFIPTEADTIGFVPRINSRDEQNLPWELAQPSAYLGDGSLTLETIKSPTGSLSSRLLEPSKDTFATAIPNWLPPGRRLAVHRGMKHFLRTNSRKEMLQKRGLFSMESPSGSDSDSVLDLFDLSEDFDEQTIREMEEERLEKERLDARAGEHSLSPDRVKQVLADAVEAIEVTWQETKLPKHQKKAYHLWHDARRRGNRTRQVLEAHTQSKFYDDRIKKLCTEISGETWPKEGDLRDQARCLEQSIHDKLYNAWLVQMLESRTEPPKPETVARPKLQPRRRDAADSLAEEILTSSDEDDFIEPDDEPEVGNGDAMDLDEALYYGNHDPSPERGRRESPEYIDLTQVWETSSPTGVKTQGFVDLTSPIKPESTQNSQANDGPTSTPAGPDSAITAPDVESLGSFEEIGAHSIKQWAKSKDRWKLLICLIWKLPHIRRSAILRFIQETSEEDAWRETVEAQMTHPLEDIKSLEKQTSKTMAFDITLAFLSFSRMRQYSESHLVPFPLKMKGKIEKAKRSFFRPFCSFIKDTAHHFPQDSQIHRAETPEGELEDDDLDDTASLGDGETRQPKRRKTGPKEIIQNKAAVDLRKRESERMAEQELRRKKLRATLAISDEISRDRTRMIINESKQDDQSFIYINEEIGKQIKEHQVDGVRFMWNQVVAAEERTGCLLAHTMGLGKTMQVITLLVAIQESSKSSDPSIRAQIPEDLRASQTLVLCPPGLVHNWMDELLLWAPEGILGHFRKIDALLSPSERHAAIRAWATDGGVLVIGYQMLSQMLSSNEASEELLVDKPSIIVADEAHQIKNEKTIVHQSCARFRSLSRIALTGSPLANNVEEYRAMLDWVAPTFLGPLPEFRQVYATPIQHGLYSDSTRGEKRIALKTLEALRELVQPKVHRATIKSCLKDDLPSKLEFVISVAPTPLQSKLYALYIDALVQGGVANGKMPQSRLFSITNHLGLICNHPRCFQQKVKQISDGILGDEEDTTFPRSIIQPVLKELKVPDLDLASLSRKVELLSIILDKARDLGDKVLIFCQSLTIIDYLINLFKMQKRRVSILTGKTVISKRQEMIKNFNVGDQEVYLISTTAGGVGLNIQGANRVVIFDIKWNPVHEQQAIGRAYRIGQTKGVFVYRFVVAGTFEEDLQNKHVFKTQLAYRVVDKKNPVSWSNRNAKIIHEIRPTLAQSLKEFEGMDSILDTLMKYGKKDEAIRSILLTDTFEKEDEAVQFSVDELRDVNEMVKLNGLHSNEEFQRAKAKADEAEFHRLPRMSRPFLPSTPSTPSALPTSPDESVPPSNQQSVNQSLDGSLDAPDPIRIWQRHDRHSTASALNGGLQQESRPLPPQAPFSGLGAVPLPVAGTNTYFGTKISRATEPVTTVTPERSKEANSSEPTPGPKPKLGAFARGSLFSQVRSQPKTDFQTSLEKRVSALSEARLLKPQESPDKVAQSLTTAISAVREEGEFGFLPDNQHWKHLHELLVHSKFVIALVSGHWTPSYVALADKKALESRMDAMDGLPVTEIPVHASRRAHSPDPDNLHNIQRQGMAAGSTPRGPHARKDWEVMCEAADNRKRRSIRLPTWANQALIEEQNRALPASDTVESLTDRRSGSRNLSARDQQETLNGR
ncbi:hypothetical protein EDB81DRAFT_162052 [Dactylonectria macrodidyma]|uniref:Uncharacterized protein n=1 Tax=Dactylonectria macrodidyma TaxID=307937 RepID=A0A9P9FQ65_9HYPO|nr:hypothetical protein EDB81DRAFT_162052 [Dactylonectria macrodidyma]